MRVLVLDYPEEMLAERRRLGLDKWDEVWDGVIHMVPPPHGEHGKLDLGLGHALYSILRRTRAGSLFREVGVRPPGSELTNFRVPDIAFLATNRLDIYYDGWINGGPDVVFELRSPGDESYEKLPFYAKVGVSEVVIVDRDTKNIEVFRPDGSSQAPVGADAEGWLQVERMRISLKTGLVDGKPVVLVRDEATGEVLDTREPV